MYPFDDIYLHINILCWPVWEVTTYGGCLPYQTVLPNRQLAVSLHSPQPLVTSAYMSLPYSQTIIKFGIACRSVALIGWQREVEVWLAVSCDHRRGVYAHSEHSTFSSAAHRENWKDCAISSSWIRQSSNKRTSFERCTPAIERLIECCTFYFTL